MNKNELIIKVSGKSQVDAGVCRQVLSALEEVLSAEFSDSGNMGNAFDKAFRMMNFFKKKKTSL